MPAGVVVFLLVIFGSALVAAGPAAVRFLRCQARRADPSPSHRHTGGLTVNKQ